VRAKQRFSRLLVAGWDLKKKEHRFDGRVDHFCLEIDSFTKAKIIIDGNYQSWHALGELGNLLGPEVKKKLIANDFHISPLSDVLIYALVSTGEEVESGYQPGEYETIRLCSYTGRKEIWKTNIPFPHLLITSDRREKRISSGYYFNLGLLYDSQGKLQEAEQHYLEIKD